MRRKNKKIVVEREHSIALADQTIIQADALTALRRLPSNSARCIVTSPPYWGLRDYGIEQQIGLEESMQQYLNKLIAIFSEARRVLSNDGTLWLNIGDGFTSGNRAYRAADKKNPARAMSSRPSNPDGLKNKDLLGIPWRLAFALQADGWYLRTDIIWNKPNAMPESVKDRPTRSHEYIFMLTKAEKYYYHHEAVRELSSTGAKRNRRSVWNVETQRFSDAHFATFPPDLIEPCIAASSAPGDVVLDPFLGSGTVGLVCQNMQRRFIGIELNPQYVQMAEKRLGHSEQQIIVLAA